MPSARLDAIVNMTPPATTAADIGSDHGKTAVMLLKSGKARHVICTDISAKSLEKAIALAEKQEMEDRISFRVGDGFEVLREGEADIAIISGMGGDLISRILKEGKAILPSALVLSCNSKAEVLRGWLYINGYHIEDEDMVFENRCFYPVIYAVKGEKPPLSGLALEAGPALLQKKPEILIRFIEMRIQKTEEKVRKIMASDSAESEKKLEDLKSRLAEYAEVLK